MFLFLGVKEIILDSAMDLVNMYVSQNQSVDYKAKKLFNFPQVYTNCTLSKVHKYNSPYYLGSLHVLALTDDGEVYAWGDNDEGQLGDGTTHPIARPRPIAALKVN